MGKSRNPDILGLQKYIGIIAGDKGFIIQQPWKRNLIFVIENVTFRRTFIKLFLSIEKKVISVPMYLLLYGADIPIKPGCILWWSDYLKNILGVVKNNKSGFYLRFLCISWKGLLDVVSWSKHFFEGCIVLKQLPYSNRISPWLTEFGPLPWQAKQTVSAHCQLQPATQAGQILLTLAKFC